MPAPWTDVVKYLILDFVLAEKYRSPFQLDVYPSTSPSFFPLAANSLLNSTPAK